MYKLEVDWFCERRQVSCGFAGSQYYERIAQEEPDNQTKPSLLPDFAPMILNHVECS